MTAYFGFWKNDNLETAISQYDCENCIDKGLNKARACFKFDKSDYNTLNIRVPYRNKDGNVERDLMKWRVESVSYHNIFDVLETYSVLAPKTPIFEQMIMSAIAFENPKETKEICPIAFMTNTADHMLLLESVCEKYHCLPYNGNSIESQPNWVMDAFITISVAKDRYNTRKREIEMVKAKQQNSAKGLKP